MTVPDRSPTVPGTVQGERVSHRSRVPPPMGERGGEHSQRPERDTSSLQSRGTVDRPDLALADAVRSALDDERIRLPMRATERFISALADQFAVRGYVLARKVGEFTRPTAEEIAGGLS